MQEEHAQSEEAPQEEVNEPTFEEQIAALGKQDETDTPSEEPAAEATTDDAPQVEEPYQPNYGYKVNGEDKEFDEHLRGVITNKEQEEAMRMRFQKSAGLDLIRPKYEERGKQLEEVRGYAKEAYSELESYSGLKTSKDVAGIMKKFGITEDDMYAHVDKLIEEEELPQAEKDRRAHEAHQQAQHNQFSEQQTQLSNQMNEFTVMKHDHEMNQELSKPDAQSVLTAYDSHNGKGSFEQYVNHVGYMHEKSTGTVPKVADVVDYVVNQFKTMGQGAATDAAPAAQAPEATEAPATLPTLGASKSVSPSAANPIKSIGDLQKIMEARAAAL